MAAGGAQAGVADGGMVRRVGSSDRGRTRFPNSMLGQGGSRKDVIAGRGGWRMNSRRFPLEGVPPRSPPSWAGITVGERLKRRLEACGYKGCHRGLALMATSEAKPCG